MNGGDVNTTGAVQSSASTIVGPTVPSIGPTNTEVIGAPPINPLDPEAPIHHLLDVNRNPTVKDMSTEELNLLITKLRTNATSPQTLTATLQADSKRKRPLTEAQRKRKELIDSL